MNIVKNDLFDYKDRYIYQLKDGFKFSLDSILLAEFINLNKVNTVLDMCTGNAPLPLIITTKKDVNVVGFEIQKEIYELAEKSIKLNNLNKQISIINDDINNISKYYPLESFDAITCNPPYFKVSNLKCINKSDILSMARHEITIKLEDIFSLASKYLKPNGSFYLIHRIERLDEIILLSNKYNIFVKELQLVSTKDISHPNTIIVKCVKNSKLGIKILPIICVDKLNTYQHLFERR